MAMAEMNWNPSDRQLRQFGGIALAAFPAAAWLWSAGNPTAVLAAAVCGGALAGLAMVYPRGAKPLYIMLCLAAMPIGLAVSEITLALLFYGVVVPLGMIFRLAGRDALRLRIDRSAESYWRPKRQPTDPATYLRQW
jgi:hypothetical protein